MFRVPLWQKHQREEPDIPPWNRYQGFPHAQISHSPLQDDQGRHVVAAAKIKVLPVTRTPRLLFPKIDETALVSSTLDLSLSRKPRD